MTLFEVGESATAIVKEYGIGRSTILLLLKKQTMIYIWYNY
ncbi:MULTISPECIES: hypothetical protein [unclassified Lysinibacillus]